MLLLLLLLPAMARQRRVPDELHRWRCCVAIEITCYGHASAEGGNVRAHA